VKSLFQSHVEQKKLGLKPATHQELKRTILKLPEIDTLGVKWSKKNYPNGYTSYGSLSNLDQQFSVFHELKRLLDREAKKFASAIGIEFPRGELVLSSLWANVMPKHCYHAFHLHPNSIVSGTYYVSIPKGTSPLRIEDPRAPLFMAYPARSIQKDLIAKEGEIILFESWMKHEVPPHSSSDLRVSVSFNYDWIQS
jgi:hypothetical protein